MSNCLFFPANNVVRFNAFDISIMRMRSLLRDCPREIPDCEKDPINFAVWYYLKTCTVVDDTGVTISFGAGRSCHTWRDFRYLVNYVLRPIMLRKKEHVFIAEDPGYPGKFRLPVVFGEEMK